MAKSTFQLKMLQQHIQARNNVAVNQISYLENDYLIRRIYRNLNEKKNPKTIPGARHAENCSSSNMHWFESHHKTEHRLFSLKIQN